MHKKGDIEGYLNKITIGDSLEIMKKLPNDCIDLVASDPPYAIGFMGKEWDKVVIPVKYWKEMLRVLKPGAFAYIMSAPRQDVLSHMIVNLDKAGFMTGFTSIYWAYASGFPKAQNISKAIDKRVGAEREVVGKSNRVIAKNPKNTNYVGTSTFAETAEGREKSKYITKPATQEAIQFDGAYGGFQPKPAVEIIIVVMKPLSEKTFIDQALHNGKGITWLDSVRVPFSAPASVPDTVFDVLAQACEHVQGFVDTTTLYNTNYKDHAHHGNDCDHIQDNLFYQFLVYARNHPHFSNVLEYVRIGNTIEDFQSYCPVCCRLYDVLFRLSQASVQGDFPSQADVLEHISRFAQEHTHNQMNKYSAHLSNVDVLFHILQEMVLDLDLTYYKDTCNAISSQQKQGRFPANLLVSDDILDNGVAHNTGSLTGQPRTENKIYSSAGNTLGNSRFHNGDTGQFSRFFSLDT